MQMCRQFWGGAVYHQYNCNIGVSFYCLDRTLRTHVQRFGYTVSNYY